jgi:ribonucleoside-diphosphate reductase alpha chain
MDSGQRSSIRAPMFEPSRHSPFIDLAAVEAWDAWFRWRDRARLRDFSIEDTWRRMAGALASTELQDERAAWQSHFMEAFTSWRLLPDERLIATAGTERVTWHGAPLHAVINAAAFVQWQRDNGPGIDLAALSACAGLAVRALDNAALLARIAVPGIRVGLMGVADALALLGLDYDGHAGRTMAGAFGQALAEGCLRGSIALAAARGEIAGDLHAIAARAISRGMPPELVKALMRHGVRHDPLTAITSQRRLALLANDVADALDPLQGENHANHITAAGGPRMIRSSGYALNVLRNGNACGPAKNPDTLAQLPWKAQMGMRAVVQPWIDEPITYPMLTTRDLDDDQLRAARREAVSLGYDPFTFRDPAAALS